MITLKSNNKSVEFANVAEVFKKDGKNTSREFRNKLFGSYLTDEFDSAIKLAENIKERKTLYECYINNLSTLEEAIAPDVADENFKRYSTHIENMDATQLDSLASAIAEQKAKLNS